MNRQASQVWGQGTIETLNRTRQQQYLPDVVRALIYDINRQKSAPQGRGLINGKALIVPSQIEYIVAHINSMMETIGDLQDQLKALEAEREHLIELPPSAPPRGCHCKTERPPVKPESEWLTVKQYAVKYGMSVHAVNGRRRRKNNPLPARKLAGKPWEVMDVPC